ncbi:MAG: carbamate kinase [Bacteroidota bacterium]
MEESILIAVGGNSLIRAGQRGTSAEQQLNARLTAERIAEIALLYRKLIVTHGNGPQVGAQLLRSEIGSGQTYAIPLDVCVAMTQGEIGFALQSALQSVLAKREIHRPVVSFLTLVVVDKNDPAFLKPTKPVGPFYSKKTAEHKRSQLGWSIIEDASRGYRRVVASPLPKEIVELQTLRECLEKEIIVIAAGGGGIPVLCEGNEIRGVEAVIDKDRASSLLASKLGIEHLLISTEVPEVYTNFRRPDQAAIRKATLKEMQQMLAANYFAEGSMRPKIEAAIDFLSAGGTTVTITDPEHIIEALHGDAGTVIVRSS